MSGIAAVLNLDGSPVPRSDVERLGNVLKPYGPDRQKTLVLGNAAFVSCLHHLTPEDLLERQPIHFSNRFVMLFDGRVDNRSELGSLLGMAASEVRSMPDSMIALHLFDRWGEQAFGRIVGVFAIIVMDLRERSLVCARDHMGLRVLHYCHSGARFAVATCPDALFALSWVPRVLNRDKIADTLVDRGLNGETTYYQDIFRVLPGSIVRQGAASLSKDRFWNPENIPEIRFKKDQEYVEAFQHHLEAAVKATLRSRKTPCASITGGLNSSSIAVIAADMLAATGKQLTTFTAVPEDGFKKEETRCRYFDETPYVLQIAEKNPHIVPHFVPPREGSIVEQISELIQKGGGPSGGVLNDLWGMDVLTAARSAGYNVMLSGEMGNHTMSYSGRPLVAELLSAGRLFRLIREIKSSGYNWRYMLCHCTIAPFIPAPLFLRYRRWRRGGTPPWHDFSAIHPEFAARSGVLDRAAREYLPFDTPPPKNNKLFRIHMLNSYVETADWFARLRAKFGIDVRTPAFDRRVVEFCIGIPIDQYLHNGCDRWLIRRAMKGRLPSAVLDKKKYGFQAADWFTRLTRERDRLRAEVKRLGKNSELSSMIDFQKLNALLKDWPDAAPASGPEAFPLIWALPQALGAARFIEDVTGSNLER